METDYFCLAQPHRPFIARRDARADSDAEVTRLKEKMDRLNGDYFQSKAEVTALEKKAKQVSDEFSVAKGELGDAKLAASKLSFEAERMRDELDELRPRAAKMAEELQAERKGRKKVEKERGQVQAQLVGLQEVCAFPIHPPPPHTPPSPLKDVLVSTPRCLTICCLQLINQVVETQQTHGRALVEQLREVGQSEARAAALEQANSALEAELEAVRADLEEREAHFTVKMDKMREEVRQPLPRASC
jgi:septal ring factor EnvC (AmiA/AmiB activator)